LITITTVGCAIMTVRVPAARAFGLDPDQYNLVRPNFRRNAHLISRKIVSALQRRIVIRVLVATLALLGAAHAQTPSRCPELMQLNTDAEAALRKADGLTGQDRCDSLVHYSAAWADIDNYARDHRELCGISTSSLNDIAESHKRAVRGREDACGGRRALTPPLWPQPGPRFSPFPAEVRPRW
jgi:hypothetical protein